MGHRVRPGLWIGIALLLIVVDTSCCRKKGTVCLYDKPCGGAVGISWMPEGDWGYGLKVQTIGPHTATNKALAVCKEDGDGFVVYGDGRVVASNLCEFNAPITLNWMPEGDWEYGLRVQTIGPHTATNKALAVCKEDGDGFVVYGDGRVVASNLCEFNAPIKVKEIYTDGRAKWPDYVFESSYKLRSLYDLEAFIRQNKHLPGLPSQAMMVREGVPLVSTQKALMEKVEELTLYVIALQKQVDSLKALLQADSRTSSR